MTKIFTNEDQQTPLDEYQFANAGVLIASVKGLSRMSLRANDEGVQGAEKALGVKLPQKPKTSESKDGRHSLWIGPDEWLVLDEKSELKVSAIDKVSQVDVSHRNVAFQIKGKKVEQVLSAGCPQDVSLEVFPVGACSRTLFGKAEVVLWRKAEDEFHLECWRSFSPYVGEYLHKAGQSALY